MKKMLLRTALGALAALAVQGRAQTVTEYELKAAYLFHFLQFTAWPPAQLERADALQICIDASHPMRRSLDALTRQRVREKAVAIATDLSKNPSPCHVAIVDRRTLAELPPQLTGSPALLTVSDDPQLGLDDVIITLRVRDDRVVFSINKTEARKRGLEISSKLLRLAETVQ